MEDEIFKVKGYLNSFMSGESELSINGIGYTSLTVRERDVLLNRLTDILYLLRVGAMRQLRESEGE